MGVFDQPRGGAVSSCLLDMKDAAESAAAAEGTHAAKALHSICKSSEK
jgi:hypothetical protein